jgi:hypothetical protein
MDFEKFKLELILKGFKLDHQAYDSGSSTKQFYARIVPMDLVYYDADEEIADRNKRLGLLSETGHWIYFSWGQTEQEAINNVYLTWTMKKKS